MRLKAPSFLALGALVGLVIVYATDQVVPASSPREAQLRLWLAARATGITVYLLLSLQVLLGLVLSHPVNQTTWKLSKRLYPWHENLLVFVLAFIGAHIVGLILDPYAGVSVAGAFVPGLSSYRSAPVALGTLALYALLATGLTARYTRLLPPGVWLKLHRLTLVVWILGWAHGVLSGTDSDALRPMYVASGVAMVAAAAYRYWVARKARRSFATSLPGALPAAAGHRREASPVGPTTAPAVQAFAAGTVRASVVSHSLVSPSTAEVSR
ncbi:MAG TPA: hypothetical protein VF763_15070 [Candidatus Limnocylindrales bacterium]